jgi:hypothetical protein
MQPTHSMLNRALQRRSYAIASLQQKLDAQRAESLDLQTKYKKLQVTLITLLDMWRDLKNVPLSASEWEERPQRRNESNLPEQLPANNQSCPCPTSSAELLAEHHPPITIQPCPCPTSSAELLVGQHPAINQSTNASTPTPPSLPPPPQPTPPIPANNAEPSLPSSPASPKQPASLPTPPVTVFENHPNVSLLQPGTTRMVGSVQVNTHPANQTHCHFPSSGKGWIPRKRGHYNTKPANQRTPRVPEHLDTWFEGFPNLPLKPLHHGPIWGHPESTTVCHTCAPPPGWEIVNGITVPPLPILHVDTRASTIREEGDDNLGVWFCTKCYLGPIEKPPDFEMCNSCAENYYFPYPPALTKGWVCQGCFHLCKGQSRAYRQCYCCGRTEEFAM